MPHRKSCNVIFLILLAVTSLGAQPFTRVLSGIPVKVDGQQLAEPFTGGIDNPRHQFVDIDGDGDVDLFLLDSDGSMNFYRNTGTAEAPTFTYCRNCITLPKFAYWYYFVDLNGDGTYDLCTDDSASGVRLYTNIGTARSPNFVLSVPTVSDSSGTPMIGAPVGAPTFADLNGDSLLDFVSSNISGSFNYYENIGTRTSPLFRFVTDTFQNIIILGDTCPGPAVSPSHVTHHGGGNLQFADIDANGTPDMFYGDLFSHGVFFMRNDGSPSVPVIHCVTSRYPDPSMVTTGFNQPTLVDIDGDGVLDLFVGVLSIMPRHNFWYYANAGSARVPDFTLRSTDVLPSLDAGSSLHPALVDVDGNGTYDLIAGTLEGRLWLFTNEGTPSSPSFTLADTMFGGISGNFTYAPAFVDIDNDGDKDMFIGRFDGKIRYYRNAGTPVVPAYVPDVSPVDSLGVLRNAAPAFVDIDADGDQDLFVGKANGSLGFYRNTGNNSTFVPLLVDPAFEAINVGEDATPAFVYNPDHRCYDLYVGNAEGKLFCFQNLGDSALPDFVLQTDHFADIDPLREGAPAFADIDNDGDQDLFVGTSKGGVHHYRNDILASVAPDREIPSSLELRQNYPNPFNPETKFEIRNSQFEMVTFVIFDLVGRKIDVLLDDAMEPGVHTIRWDASSCSAGVYIGRLTAGRQTITRKLLLIK